MSEIQPLSYETLWLMRWRNPDCYSLYDSVCRKERCNAPNTADKQQELEKLLWPIQNDVMFLVASASFWFIVSPVNYCIIFTFK
jgi:hypothetical protein